MHPISTFSLEQTFTHTLEISEVLFEQFRAFSKDENPLHIKQKVAYGNILGYLVSYLVGMGLPTSNVMLISQTIHFKKPSYINDCITLSGVVKTISEAASVIELKLKFTNQNQVTVAIGSCTVKITNEGEAYS